MFLFALCSIFSFFIVTVISQKEAGICDKPCTGGPNDLCVKCPTPCPVTCTTIDTPRPCPALCLANGCECASGYLRENGQCILPSKCPKNVTSPCDNCNKLNMKCVRCYNSCQKTCRQLLDPFSQTDYCSISCGGYHCECDDDYFLADDGRCVLEVDCMLQQQEEIEPPVLPAPIPQCDEPCHGGLHDKCVLCGNKCPLTCDNYNSPPFCTTDCVPDVCQCENGYVRNHDGKCVLPENCPTKNKAVIKKEHLNHKRKNKNLRKNFSKS